ncbi:MAG TPA: RNA methyltransferase [Myxococcales bacterium]|nr:RNA methyltransferase [Myxococcales bacterium]
MEDRLRSVRFVLCRPRNPLNLGAVARALRCGGIGSWALVDPRTRDFETARTAAVHAEELLDQARICATLREALQGCALSVGTTARRRAERPLLHPREAAQRLIEAGGEVAIVFGDERSGMTAEEAEAVDLLSTIPAAPEQPSWNLAQAVAIFAHELRTAASASGDRKESLPRGEADPGALAAADRALGEAARSLGKPNARRRLFRALERAALTRREAALWTAFFHALTRR